MLLGNVVDRFVAATPVAVATRGLLERALSAPALDALFQRTAQTQYTRELLFSTCVDLMGSVVGRVQRSLHAAYTADVQRVAACR